MSVLRFGALLLLMLLSVTVPAAAESSAEDKATARELAAEGQAALDAKDFAKAADLFQRAESLFHAPSLLLGVARANTGLGRYVRAREAYNKIIREGLPPDAPEAFVTAKRDAQSEIGAVEAKIGWVTIRVEGTDKAVVTVDDEPVPAAALGVKRAVDPGEHVVKASAEGFTPAEQRVSVQSAQEPVEVVLTLEPGEGGGEGSGAAGAEGGSGSLLQTIGFVGIGVGAAGLVVGAITGGLAMGKHGSLEDACPEGQCPSSEQGTLDSYHTLGTVSTVGFIAGGVLAAAGLVLVLVAPSDEAEPAPTAAMQLGPTSAGLTIRF